MSSTRQIRQQDQFSRLSAADVAVLGRYLFVNRWQTALSRELKISRQIIVAWAGSKRPVSRRFSLEIARIVGTQHERRRERDAARYLAMIESITSDSARTMLLDMLAQEVEIRVKAISMLARNGHRSSDPKIMGGAAPLAAAKQRER